jgi:uncharacterized iron-regulated membrane protein
LARSTTTQLRRLWFNIHLWIGVGLFIGLIPLGVTGALLVWDQPLDHALHAGRFAVSKTRPDLAPSAYLATAKAAFGDRAAVTNLRLPQAAGIPVTVVGRMAGPPAANGRPRQLTAWLDPATAKVVDVADISQSMFSVIHRLHGSLLIPDTGRKVVGWLGVALTASSLTGLWLWWPRSGRLLLGLRWRRTPMTIDNLHHLVGFWACAPLAVLSLTGVYIAFPQTSHRLFGVPAPQQRQGPAPARPTPRPLLTTAMGIDDAVKAAGRPDARLVTASLPTEGGQPSWRLEFSTASGANLRLLVADATGEAQPDRGGRGDGAGASGPPDRVSPLMRKIHDGADTGPIWQAIITLAGVAPAILGITGLIMWLRSRGRKARMQTLKSQPAE